MQSQYEQWRTLIGDTEAEFANALDELYLARVDYEWSDEHSRWIAKIDEPVGVFRFWREGDHWHITTPVAPKHQRIIATGMLRIHLYRVIDLAYPWHCVKSEN